MTISHDEFKSLIQNVQEVRNMAEKKLTDISAEAKAKEEKLLSEVTSIQQKLAVQEASQKKIEQDFADSVKSLEKAAHRIGAGESGSEEKEAAAVYKKAMDKYIRTGHNSGFTALEEVKSVIETNPILARDIKSLVAGINPDGGYLVMPEFGGVKKGQIFETSPIRQLATTVSISTDVYEYVIDDDQLGAVEWVGEMTAPSETATPNIGLGQIATHQMAVEPKISQKLLDDAMVNVDQWLVDKINDRFIRGENTAFVSGDGANKPKGFVSYPAWDSAGVYQRNKIEQINSGSAGAVTADGIKNLISGLKEPYQPNAVFLMQRATFGAVTKLKDGVGSYLLNVDSPREGDALRMGGKPVMFADDMQAVASDALAIAYGDFRAGYTIVDRLGVRVMRDPYTGKPFVKFYATKRVGGAVTNFEAIKIQKLAA